MENKPPQTAKEPPILGASLRMASNPPWRMYPRGELYAPLHKWTTPPPMAPMAKAPPRSSRILCGHGSRPWSTFVAMIRNSDSLSSDRRSGVNCAFWMTVRATPGGFFAPGETKNARLTKSLSFFFSLRLTCESLVLNSLSF